jgi:hypothetical protein
MTIRLSDAVARDRRLVQVETRARGFWSHQAAVFEHRHFLQDGRRAGYILDHECMRDGGQQVDVALRDDLTT